MRYALVAYSKLVTKPVFGPIIKPVMGPNKEFFSLNFKMAYLYYALKPSFILRWPNNESWATSGISKISTHGSGTKNMT